MEGSGAMKVVLREDVPKVGAAGSIQTVKDGFARNYLIPKGLAEPATPAALKEAEQRLQARQRQIAREEAALRSVAERIDGTRIHIVARVGEQGRLFGSVTAQEIADAVTGELGLDPPLDRRKVLLDEPIRTVGEFPVTIHLVGQLRPVVTVVVTPEEGVPGAFGETETTPASEDVASSAQSGPAAEIIDEMGLEPGQQG